MTSPLLGEAVPKLKWDWKTCIRSTAISSGATPLEEPRRGSRPSLWFRSTVHGLGADATLIDGGRRSVNFVPPHFGLFGARRKIDPAADFLIKDHRALARSRGS